MRKLDKLHDVYDEAILRVCDMRTSRKADDLFLGLLLSHLRELVELAPEAMSWKPKNRQEYAEHLIRACRSFAVASGDEAAVARSDAEPFWLCYPVTRETIRQKAVERAA
jgi:hypothetical protein